MRNAIWALFFATLASFCQNEQVVKRQTCIVEANL